MTADKTNSQHDPRVRTFAITVAYDGTHYGGWQRQINALGVQQVLEEAIEKALASASKTLASGRTDRGVHAIGQVVRFRTRSWQHDPRSLMPALNRHLPPDIAVQDIRETTHLFHPIRQAICKTYRYTLRLAKSPDPITSKTAWYIPRPLDFDKLIETAQYLVGEHDFASFQSLGSPRTSTIRIMHEIKFNARSNRVGFDLMIDLRANGFLYNMARSIVGTLVTIAGQVDASPASILEILAARDRKRAGQNAPSWGLCLQQVEYPEELFLTPPLDLYPGTEQVLKQLGPDAK